MSAPPSLLSPFVRTRTRLSLTIGLVLAALTAVLLPWWQPEAPPGTSGGRATDAKPVATGPRNEAAALVEAIRTGKNVLVETATTATTQTWALPNGLLRSRIHALPQRAKNADGRWAPIDNNLKRTGDAADGLGIAPVNAAYPVRFASGGKQSSRATRSYLRAPLNPRPEGASGEESLLAQVTIRGHAISYTWPGPLPEPTLSGPRALYSEVFPGVDLLVVAREEGGFAQLLIVKNAEAARNPVLATVSYGLRSDTATFSHDAAVGRVVVHDPKGTEIGSVPTPFAWDSSGRTSEAGEPETGSVATPEDVLRLPGLSGIEPGARQTSLPLGFENERPGAARLNMNIAAMSLFDENVKFPVFVDPTLNPGWQAWTVAYKPYPNSSFYNGTNFSSGTSDARVGSENETNGTARSFWRMGFSSSLKGATISRATFKVLNNHSWSCTTREFQFWLTGAISSSTTWNAQPSWQTQLQKKSFAHGWSTSCPDDYEAFDVKAAAQKAADAGWANVTLGMRATSEGDTQTWRKFKATSAVMEVDYNRAPGTPTGVSSTPGGACSVSTGDGVTIGKTNIVLSATSADADGNLKGLEFRFWKVGSAIPGGTLVTAVTGGKATLTIPSTTLADKTTYAWTVRAVDTQNAYSAYFPSTPNTCRLTVDATAPAPPVVESDVFKEATDDGATWASVKFGGTGAIKFSAPGATKFRYGFDGKFVTPDPAADSTGSFTKTDLKPPHAGPNMLQVYALDAVGNVSARTDYTFYMRPRDKADAPGDVNGDGIPDLLTINNKGELLMCPGGPKGELQACMAGSYTSDNTLNPPGYWLNSTTGKPVPFTHFNDTFPGDGMNDVLAVSPDGSLYIYPGDGYGTFNVDQRIDVELPANAPAPSTIDQIVAVGDVTGDQRPEALVTTQDGSLWAFVGYSGATFDQAIRLIYGSWSDRDIFVADDVSGDGVLDLVFRNNSVGELRRREGKPNATGTGTDLLSLASAAASATPTDPVYSLSPGWQPANMTLFMAAPDKGNPDAGGDGIPDFWAMYNTGVVRFYRGGRTAHEAAYDNVITTADGLWADKLAFG